MIVEFFQRLKYATGLMILGGLLLASCSDFQQVQKSGTREEKLNAAYKYFEKKDYYKATLLFDEVVPLIKGQAEGEKALYYYAYTYYNQKQYLMAGYYFREFTETYPRSELAEESAFMYAKCLFLDSPAYNLDQTNTYDAQTAIQRFAARYPKSRYMEEANKMIDELAAKLEKKAYETAKLYYRLSEVNSSNFKSAVISFDSFLKKYPSSQYAEEVTFLKVEAQYNLARASEPSKQRERFYEAIDYYHNFIDRYPQSRYKKEAENIYDICIKKIEQLNS